MLKKTMTYTDFNGLERTEDFYFNFTKAEIAEMELGTTGGFTTVIKKIVDSKDGAAIIKTFKDLVLDSYGVKSADGRTFIKSENLRNSFAQTQAYSDLFMELATDADAAAAFVNGIVPPDVAEMAKEEGKQLTPAQIAARNAIDNAK